MFVTPFAKRGLIAETGLASSLAALVGFGRAADMLMSARRVEAEEALRMGLLNRICPPESLVADALAYARDIATNVSPRSLKVIKRQLWRARTQTFAEAAAEALEETKLSFRSDDFREGLAHFKEKRAPRFTGH